MRFVDAYRLDVTAAAKGILRVESFTRNQEYGLSILLSLDRLLEKEHEQQRRGLKLLIQEIEKLDPFPVRK